MDFRALFRNCTRAREVCRRWPDRVKYLGWLYGRTFSAGDTTLHFHLPEPVGDITLNVRPNGGSDAFIFSEVFEHRYYDFELPSPPGTVLDLGANIGLTALFFARKYPNAQIACVEPMPGNLRLLRTNLERNGVAAKIFEHAVAVDDKPVVMQIADNDYGHKVSDIDYGRPMDGATQRVEGITVPTLLKELRWEHVGLLKIDIEGYEGVLLRERCEWLDCVEAMCIECHEGYGADDLRAMASRFGFQPPRQVSGTWLLSRGYLPEK